jgi:hypothetical protein
MYRVGCCGQAVIGQSRDGRNGCTLIIPNDRKLHNILILMYKLVSVRMEKVYQSLIIPMLLTYIKFEPITNKMREKIIYKVYH